MDALSGQVITRRVFLNFSLLCTRQKFRCYHGDHFNRISNKQVFISSRCYRFESVL